MHAVLLICSSNHTKSPFSSSYDPTWLPSLRNPAFFMWLTVSWLPSLRNPVFFMQVHTHSHFIGWKAITRSDHTLINSMAYSCSVVSSSFHLLIHALSCFVIVIRSVLFRIPLSIKDTEFPPLLNSLSSSVHIQFIRNTPQSTSEFATLL